MYRPNRFFALPGRLAPVLACLALLAGTASAQARQGQGEDNRATIELVVPQTHVRPGEIIQVGVKFTMQPGWHIYWKNPGDSGQPPSFRWSLPGGGAARMMRGSEWSATDPQFPVPIRWEEPGGIVGFGYDGTVIFPAEVTIPGSATPGQTVELGIWAEYLICEAVCLSEAGGATVELTVGPESGEQPSREAQQALEQARQRLPEPARQVEVNQREDGTRSLEVELPAGAKNVGFFPNPPDGLAVENIEIQQRQNRAVVRFEVRQFQGAQVDAESFEAVVGYDVGGNRRGMSLTVPLDGEGAD